MADIVDLSSHYIGSPAPGVNLYQIPNAAMSVLADVINATWNEAKGSKTEFATKIAAAMTTFLDTTTTPHVTAGAVTVPTIAEPAVTIPTSIDVSDITDTFTTEALAQMGELASRYTAFYATHFPNEPVGYAAAETWLKDALANQEVGLPPAVAAQIFGDDHARIIEDKTRAQDAVLAQFASRGFPLPPDAAASAVTQLEQKAQDALAESSRKVAMLSVEMQKFNIEKLLALRNMAVESAVKYISVLASGADTASRVTGIGYDAQSKLISSVSQFMNARSQVAETVSKVAQYNTSTALEAAVKNQMADMGMVENKLKALLAEAQSLAQMTTALFNNLHASVGLSTSGGTTLSQSGEF